MLAACCARCINPGLSMTRALPDRLSEWLATQPAIRFPAGTALVQPHEVSSHLWYVDSGLVSLFSLGETGARYNHDFLGAGRWVFGRVAWQNSDVCCAGRALGAQALQPTLAKRLPLDLLHRWRATDPQVAAFLFDSILAVAAAGLGREADLVQRSAEQRYADLQRENPGIDAAAPQQQIAAWLGITPVALSRIRRRRASKLSESR